MPAGNSTFSIENNPKKKYIYNWWIFPSQYTIIYYKYLDFAVSVKTEWIPHQYVLSLESLEFPEFPQSVHLDFPFTLNWFGDLFFFWGGGIGSWSESNNPPNESIDFIDGIFDLKALRDKNKLTNLN